MRIATADTAMDRPGDPTDIEARMQEVLRVPTPDNLAQVSTILFNRKQGEDAARLILRAVTSHPEDWKLSLTGAVLVMQNSTRYDIVKAFIANAIEHNPDFVPAYGLLAQVRVAEGDIAGGCAQFAEAVRRFPAERASLCEYISIALLDAGYAQEGLKILMSHLETGKLTFALLNNMGCALERLNRSTESLKWYAWAVEANPADPVCSFGYACALLKAGKFAEAWPRYTARDLIVNDKLGWFLSLPRLKHGDAVAGRRILLFQEQGMGDTLQFIRFVPELIRRGADVTIATFAPLLRILAQSFPEATVRSLPECRAEDGYDFGAPIPDLPAIAGVRSERDVPAEVPYLRADPELVAQFAARMPPGRPRIGIVWAGERRVHSMEVLADQRRSTTLAEMAAALCPVDATLVNLQYGAPRAQLAEWQGQAIFDPMGDVGDVADTAAIMESLDLVISVDTSPLHMAGALGRPVWLVSRWDACWRWGDEGEQSAWYPTMRVFRAQERSFVPVLREVGAALREWVAHWRPEGA